MSDITKHIARTDVPNAGKAWCGRNVIGVWAFVDIDHATLTREQRQYLLPCKQCVTKVVKELTNRE